MRSILASLIAAVAIAGPQMGFADSPDSVSPPGPAFAALLTLGTPNYTGGLNRADRAVAEAIYDNMKVRYHAKCGAPNNAAGELVGFTPGHKDEKPVPIDHVEPELAFLMRQLDNSSQEIRDVATYTIGMLGPDAKDAEPLLEGRFGDHRIKGGWYNIAYENVSCQRVVPADFRRTIPDNQLPPGDSRSDTVKDLASWRAFLRASSLLIAKLYLDKDVEYPPGMLSYAFENYAMADFSADAVPLLARILDDGNLSRQKRVDTAEALTRVKEQYVSAALPSLLRAADSNDPALHYYVGETLVRLHNPRAINLVIARIDEHNWGASWKRDLCGYGHAAVVAEDRLMETAQRSSWPSVVDNAVETLGCIQSRKSVPLLLSFLDSNDWKLVWLSAKALGDIGDPKAEVLAGLRRIAQTHWSKKVRDAAAASADKLSGVTEKPAAQNAKSGIETIVIGGEPAPNDHGLPWCDEHGRYSIDGQRWFDVKWIEPSLMPVPQGFPRKDILQGVGSQTFVPVQDGWLMGSDGFESEGVLVHVSRDGEMTFLDRDRDPGDGGPPAWGDTTIKGIEKIGNSYFAFGYALLTVGNDVGILWKIARADNGEWSAKRLLVLPGAPYAYAIAPSGELLLSDGPNDYAVVRGAVVPLKCEKTFPGGFFDHK
jgi:hypothetical protein